MASVATSYDWRHNSQLYSDVPKHEGVTSGPKELQKPKLNSVLDFHAKYWNSKSPLNISQIDRTRERSLLAKLAGRTFVITLNNYYR